MTITSVVRKDDLMYDRFGIHKPSEFDFFQTGARWGQNGYLNQLYGISSPQYYFRSFQLGTTVPKREICTLTKNQVPETTISRQEKLKINCKTIILLPFL